MNYKLAEKYDKNFIKENIMGPNPIKLAEELFTLSPIPRNAVILDLGCGRGVTSIFLAKEYGATVVAADLWVDPEDNQKRFQALGLDEKRIAPIKAEAHQLFFAEEYFDVVVSIDSYHYFGLDPKYLDQHLLPYVKHGGYLFFAVPGLKRDIHNNIPPEMLLSWTPEDLQTMHDVRYWKRILAAAEGVDVISVCEMGSFDECWNDWLECENEYAVNDRKAMEAGAGQYMNFIGIILRRK